MTYSTCICENGNLIIFENTIKILEKQITLNILLDFPFWIETIGLG